MLSSLTFITSNPKKAEQLGLHLDFPVEHKKIDLQEIQSLNLEEVVRAKAETAFQKMQSSVLVEDTALTFQSLGKLPGPLIKWFLQELTNEGLCRLLDGYTSRAATATVAFDLFDGKEHVIVTGKMAGTIAPRPRGETGFGWDSIFIPLGKEKTWGEMNSEEQKQTSIRRLALEKLQQHLTKR